jgi:tetratricopeptide (TPR) repeat protein
MPISTRRQTASSSLNSSPITRKSGQRSTDDNESFLREEITRSLYLGEFDHAHKFFCELLHPTKGPFPWTDIHDYARFLLMINLPMRAFRVLRKSALLDHPIAGFIAVEALVTMSKEELEEGDKISKLNEANELLSSLKYTKCDILTKIQWEERRDRLTDKICTLLIKKSISKSASVEPHLFLADFTRLISLIREEEYEQAIELCNYYGSSPIAVPNEFLPSYLYSLFQCRKKEELFHLSQWLIDEQGHLPYAWYGAALYYKLLSETTAGHEDKVKRFFLKSVAKDSTFIEGWLGIGELYSGRTGDHDLAIKAFRNALNCSVSQGRDDGIEWSCLFLASEYLRVKKPFEALQSIEEFSDSGQFLNERIVSLYQMGKLNEASQLLGRIEISDDHLLMNFAAVLIKLGDFRKAHALLSGVKSPSLQTEPHFLRLNSFVNEILGFQTLNADHLTLAVTSYDRLLEIDPHDIFSKDARGKTLLLLKYLSQTKQPPRIDITKTANCESFSGEEQGEAEMDCD